MSVDRMEVLSGVLRRRNWSAELKERIVSETLEPGVTVTEVVRVLSTLVSLRVLPR